MGNKNTTEKSLAKSLDKSIEKYDVGLTLDKSLEEAIKRRDVNLVNKLLDSSANVNSKQLARSPLDMAIFQSDEIITTLIQRGADVNWAIIQGDKDLNCFQKIIFKLRHSETNRLELLSLCLSHGADPNQYTSYTSENHFVQDTEKFYLISYLAKLNNIDCIKLLLEAKGDVHINSYYELAIPAVTIKETPLHIAVTNRNWEMIKLLIEWNADCNLLNDNIDERLNEVTQEYQVVKIHETCLHMAIKALDMDLVRLLIMNGANPYIPKNEIFDSFNYPVNITSWDLCGDIENMKNLLEMGYRDKDYVYLSGDNKMKIKILYLCNERNNWKLPKDIIFKIFNYIIRPYL